MRYITISLLFLLLFPLLSAQAQDNTCDIDISSVVSLLEEAQAKGSDSDASEARKLLQEAVLAIDELSTNCKGDIEPFAEKTSNLIRMGQRVN